MLPSDSRTRRRRPTRTPLGKAFAVETVWMLSCFSLNLSMFKNCLKMCKGIPVGSVLGGLGNHPFCPTSLMEVQFLGIQEVTFLK